MPLYEYRCRDCGKVSTILVGITMEKPAICCARCGGTDLERLISRVHHLLGEEARMEKMLDPSMLAGVDENDPKSIARWARKMGRGLGDDMGEDFDGLVDEMEETAAREIESGPHGDDESIPNDLD